MTNNATIYPSFPVKFYQSFEKTITLSNPLTPIFPRAVSTFSFDARNPDSSDAPSSKMPGNGSYDSDGKAHESLRRQWPRHRP